MKKKREYNFLIKKDRSGDIHLINENNEYKDIIWIHYMNDLWNCEKEGYFNKHVIERHLYEFMMKNGYTDRDINKIKELKDYDRSYSLIFSCYLLNNVIYNEGILGQIKVKIDKLLNKRIEKEVSINLSEHRYNKIFNDIERKCDNKFRERLIDFSYFDSNQITKIEAERLYNHYYPIMIEIHSAYNKSDKELVEAYRRYNDKYLKYILLWYCSILKGLKEYINNKGKRRVKVKRRKINHV